MPCWRRSTRRRIFPFVDRTLRAVLTDSTSLSPAPDILFELISYLDRRRAARQGQAAGERRRSGRRRRHARRAGSAAKVSRHPARSRGAHRSARAAATAALFHLVLAEGLTLDEVHLTVARCALFPLRAKRLRKGVASTFITEAFCPRQKVGVFMISSKGFRLPPTRRHTHHHGWPRDWHRPLSRLSRGTHCGPGAKGKQLAVLRQPAPQPGLISLLRGRYPRELPQARRPHPPPDLAFSRDQALRRYTCSTACRRHAAELWAWLQVRCPFLRVRRRPPHGPRRDQCCTPSSPNRAAARRPRRSNSWAN